MPPVDKVKAADPKRIGLHGEDLNTLVVPRVHTAGETLNKPGVGDLEGGDFSITCSAAAMGYPIAVQFAFEDIKLMADTAQDFAQKIDAAAKNYSKAEERSTAKK